MNETERMMWLLVHQLGGEARVTAADLTRNMDGAEITIAEDRATNSFVLTAKLPPKTIDGEVGLPEIGPGARVIDA